MNVKPGDLAYIVAGMESPSPNAGKVVEVKSFFGFDSEFGPSWNVKATSPLVMTDDSLLVELDVPDAWLRPISGVPVNDEVTDDIKEPA
jgi:hypothetical protein